VGCVKGKNDNFRVLSSILEWEGHGVQGQICGILRLLATLLAKHILTLWVHIFGGEGRRL
jgi:hypothetical protein